MKKTKLADFLLTIGALVVAAMIALLGAVNMIETNTAIVFLSLAVACIAMSLLDFEAPQKQKRAKIRKR